jgi:membrane-bound lytic murein transglycosylase D
MSQSPLYYKIYLLAIFVSGIKQYLFAFTMTISYYLDIMIRFYLASMILGTFLVVSGCASQKGPLAGPDGVRSAQAHDSADLEDPADSDSSLSAASENDAEELFDSSLELIESARELWIAGERERAIDALDRAYAAILDVPEESSTGAQLQQKEDLRFLISKRLTEIYFARYIATNGTDKEIPLVINEYVEREIKIFQGRERDFFLESYQRSGRYRDRMVIAFREAGLPEDITWLPLIESGFKIRAMSRARALGLWQFIPSTGSKFGLKRNAWIDERLDPDKATAAAIAYLKELHQIFGDWATVLAAYNCGEGRVLRAIRGQKINYLDNFWDLYERLPYETARYYPRFLAVLAILKDPAQYGFTLEEPDAPITYEVVSVNKPVQLKRIAAKTGFSYKALADLNPELRHKATPAAQYELKVPPGEKEAILAAVDSLPKWSPPKSTYVVHRVRRGETLSSIAQRYRTSVRKIMRANNMRSRTLIRTGQRLKVPLRKRS